MSVKREPSGRRSVQVETEVVGTPEDVWQAIATGPGVTAWFVPTDVETDASGKPVKVISHFGPGMDSAAEVKEWEPPHRFAKESPGYAPNMPPMATEWIVEARAGGKCVVRVVHSLFASTDDWDNQLESTESGWPSFFRILQLYLTHFRGQHCKCIQAMAFIAESESKAWEVLTTGLGIKDVAVGQRWTAPAGVPAASGIVEALGPGQHANNMLIRLDHPTAGIASFCAYACHGMVMAMAYLYLYGDKAQDAASREEPLWQKWMGEKFPPPAK